MRMPGDHTITSKAEKDATLQFTAEAGKTYYVWQQVKMGVWAARSGLKAPESIMKALKGGE